MPADWTDHENDAIVADYFAMLSDERAGVPFSKATHNRAVSAAIGRPRGSIEYKHQNISAVLKGLGQDWIEGYKPAFNFQMSLVDAVARWLDSHDSALAPQVGAVRDQASLWVGPPPTQSNAPPPKELDQMMFIAKKFNVAERDERNRFLGRAGEELALAHEKSSLISAGEPKLANMVRWVSQEDGDGLGYDIWSFYPDGRPRLIEVKTTNGWERTPFHISRREIAVANEKRDDWHLLRIWNFAREPKAFELRPPLEAHVSLTPTTFLAHLH